jgi:hypothetical protein
MVDIVGDQQYRADISRGPVEDTELCQFSAFRQSFVQSKDILTKIK